MEQRADIKARLIRARANARGDFLGIANDWHSLVALAGLAQDRYKETQGKEAARQYLGLIDAMITLVGMVGAKEAGDFRARHRELVGQLAPDSPAVRSLQEPPPMEAGASRH